jgi:hypothetical protein
LLEVDEGSVTAPDELNGRCCDPDLAPGELFWKSAGKCGCTGTGGNAVAAGCFKSARRCCIGISEIVICTDN